MSFYVHFESDNSEWELTKKYQIDSFATHTVESLISTFVKYYNKKVPNVLHARSLSLMKGVKLNAGDVVKDFVEDGDDLFVNVEKIELECGNHCCGKFYYEEENGDNVCQFHSGDPLFHEGYKGWTCCYKRVVEFDEIFEIPGCSFGRHVEKIKKKQKWKEYDNDDGTKLVYEDKDAKITASTGYVPQLVAVPKKEVVITFAEADPLDANIEIGTDCTRIGCNGVFRGEESRTEDCWFHYGGPIFHEGTQSWSCCNKKTLLFDEFLRLEGCTLDRHKFIKDEEINENISCRDDWYQTQNKIVLTIFAKKVDPEKSTIEITESNISLTLFFLDKPGKYVKIFELYTNIDPENSKADIRSVKVEISLQKTSASSWPSLTK